MHLFIFCSAGCSPPLLTMTGALMIGDPQSSVVQGKFIFVRQCKFRKLNQCMRIRENNARRIKKKMKIKRLGIIQSDDTTVTRFILGTLRSTKEHSLPYELLTAAELERRLLTPNNSNNNHSSVFPPFIRPLTKWLC